MIFLFFILYQFISKLIVTFCMNIAAFRSMVTIRSWCFRCRSRFYRNTWPLISVYECPPQISGRNMNWMRHCLRYLQLYETPQVNNFQTMDQLKKLVSDIHTKKLYILLTKKKKRLTCMVVTVAIFPLASGRLSKLESW